ncbi:MAG: hypothetical protein FWG46_00785 [Treponema sp.]|nr:hypothetical protein [Treponema sp.]
MQQPEGSANIEYEISKGREGLSIYFRGTEATENDIFAYFSKWTLDLDSGNKTSYFRGYAYAEFDYSRKSKSQYELHVFMHPEGNEGWPEGHILEQFGVQGMDEPPDTANVTFITDKGENGEDFLNIRFYGTEATEKAITDYFDRENWFLEVPERNEYSRGSSYAVFDTADKPYYEIYVSWNPEGDPNWPSPDVLEAFGIRGLFAPPASTFITHIIDEEENQLTIMFYGTANTEIAINTYLSSWIYEGSSEPGVFEYFKGIAWFAFNTNSKPFYQIDIFRSIDGAPGWPSELALLQFGIQDMFWMPEGEPPEATGVRHMVTEEDVLDIHFYGTTATENALKAFFANNNFREPDPNEPGYTAPEPGVTEYFRGQTYISFEPAEPFYQLFISFNIQGERGWPGDDLIEQYGLQGLTIPAGALNVSHNLEGDDPDSGDDLVIRFYASSDAAINNLIFYFDNPNNNWIKPYLVDPNIPEPPYGYYEYARGYAYVTFNTAEHPYYEIFVSWNTSEYKEGWPDEETILSYGLHGIAEPDGATYPMHSIDIITGELAIRFYGGDAQEREIRNYFATNNWTLEEAAGGIESYSRGYAWAAFDASGKPSYEIFVSVEKGEFDGWPSVYPAGHPQAGRNIILEYGLQGLENAPIKANNITFDIRLQKIDVPPDSENYQEHDQLTIRFYGDADTEEALRNYFPANNWTPEDSITGSLGYARGIAFTTFYFSDRPYFEIDVSKTIGDYTGWPNTAMMRQYGLHGFFDQGTGPSNILIPSHNPEGPDQFTIIFYGTENFSEDSILGYFENPANNWTLVSDTNGIYDFFRGITYVSFITTGAPFYEIDVSRDLEGTAGWPSADLLDEFFITDILQGDPPTLPRPDTSAMNVIHILDGDELIIQFYGDATDESAIKAYFESDADPWESLPSTDPNAVLFEYYRRATYVAFDTASKPYYELFISKSDIEGVRGWPLSTIMDAFGMHGLYQPPEGVPIDQTNPRTSYEILDDTLTIHLLDSLNWQATVNDLLQYFRTTNWKIYDGEGDPDYEPPPANIYQFHRGIAFVTFDSSSAEYTIDISRTLTGEPGWPNQTVMESYGLHGMTRPSGSNNIRSGIEDGDLFIRYYGTTTTGSLIREYFKNNNWNDEGTENDTTEYSRGYAWAVYDTSGVPFYEIYVTMNNGDYDPFWPPPNILEEFGLQGLNQPDGATFVTFSIEGDDPSDPDLAIRFYGGDAQERAIFSYFNNSLNNWSRPDPTEPGYTAPPSGVYEYVRGYAYVIFDTRGIPFYEIIASTSATGTPGWPSEGLLREYGLDGMFWTTAGGEPSGAAYIMHTPADDGIEIAFYGTAVTAGAVRGYFENAANNWSKPDANEPGYTAPPAGVYEYYRGYAYVTFDASSDPYYEISVSWSYLDPENLQGWPQAADLRNKGLHGIVRPGGALFMTHKYEGDNANVPALADLAIRFYGGDDQENVIKDYFENDTNNWQPLTDDPSDPFYVQPEPGVYQYSRGYAFVSFNTASKPFYEIYVSWSIDGADGWPSPAALEANGLQGISQPTNAMLVSHAVVEGDLAIRFYGDHSDLDALLSAFDSSAWEPQPDFGMNGMYEYSRGLAYAVLDMSGFPFFEILVSMSEEGEPGWPSVATLEKFGLRGMFWPANGEPAGVTLVRHGEEASNPDDPAKVDLAIRFYGSAVTEAVLDAYFKSNNWEPIKDTPDTPLADPPPDGVFWYSRGYAFVSFDTRGKPFYEIYASMDMEGTAGWPSQTIMTEYGLQDITQPPNATFITHSSNAADGELTVWFYGEDATQTAIVNYLESTNWELVEENPVDGLYQFYRGFAYVAFDTNSKPFYEMFVSVSFAGTQGWPSSPEILSVYKIEGLSRPEGATHVYHAVEDTGNPDKPGDLAIQFYGTSTTLKSVLDYFRSAGNAWEVPPGDPTPNVFEYSNGYHFASVDISGDPFIEIYISINNEGTPGWPSYELLKEYGLHGMFATAPGGSSFVSHNEEGDDPNDLDLVIRFYGSAGTADAVRGYFDNPVNNWTYDEDSADGRGYMRGFSYAFFNDAGPFYEIYVGMTFEGNAGLPAVQTWESFELSGIPLTTNNAQHPHHSVTGDPGLLAVQFYGTDATITDLLTFLERNGWVQDSHEDRVYGYYKSVYYISFDYSANPFFEIEVTKNAEGYKPGWPSVADMQSYGLFGLTEPAGTRDVWHLPIDDETVSNEDSLSIRFQGTPTTATALLNFFTAANGWTPAYGDPSADPPVPGPAANVYWFSRGPAFVVFDASSSSGTEFELFVSMDPASIAGWPSTGNLLDYGIPGIGSFITAANVWHYIDSEENLTIQFYGGTAIEIDVMRYFESNMWATEGLSPEYNTWGFYRRTFYASFDHNGRPYYEITVSKVVSEIMDGWPSGDILGMYEIRDMVWPNPDRSPPGAIDPGYSIGDLDGELIIEFAGSTTTENAVKDYFSGSNWTPITDPPPLPGIFAYQRGFVYAEFDTNLVVGDDPYLIFVSWSAEEADKLGWPDMATRISYGLDDLGQPPGATSMYYELVPADTTGIDPTSDSIIIKFFGTAATETFLDTYFSAANYWYLEDDANGIFEYSRHIAYVVYDPTGSPYFEITSSISEAEGTPGWPGATTLANYGLQGLSLPVGAAFTAFEMTSSTTTEPGSLRIMFYGTPATESAVLAYFENNFWTPDTASNLENPGTYAYSRGLYWVHFDPLERPSFEINAYQTVTGGTSGWPSTTLLDAYGLQSIPALSGTNSGATTFWHKEEIATDPEKSDTLMITFERNGASMTAENNMRNYFNGNGWTLDDAYEYHNPPIKQAYHRGIAWVEFEIAGNTFTLTVSRTRKPTAGWPTNANSNTGVFASYGMYNFVAMPNSGVSGPRYDAGEYELSVEFYSTATTFETTIRNHFSTANRWVTETSPGPGIYEYSRGYNYVVFDTSARPYYELIISIDEETTRGWPSPALLAEYGLTGFAALPNTTHFGLRHIVDEDVLTIWFFGANTLYSGTTAGTVRNYFNATSNGWTNMTTAVSSVYSSSFGPYSATFDYSKTPMFELSIDKEMEGEAGWPTTAIINQHGLYDFNLPAGATASWLAEDNTLVITINRGSAAQTTVSNYLSNNTSSGYFRTANGWARTGSGNTYTYTKGDYIEVVVTSTDPYYVIEATTYLEGGTAGWPDSSRLTTYRVPTLNTALSSAQNVQWIITGTGNAAELAITFFLPNGLSTVQSALTSNSWIREGTGSAPYTYGQDANNGWLELTDKNPYFELAISLQ